MADTAPGPQMFGPLLIASDFEATVRFYRDVLDLSIEGGTPYARHVSGAARFSIVDAHYWTQVNGSEMAVLRGVAVPPNTVLTVEVADVDALFEEMMASQVRFLAAPEDRPKMGLRNAFLRDPDGRMVQIVTRLSRSPSP